MKFLNRTWVFILICFAVSWAVAAIIFPQLLVLGARRLIWAHDLAIPLENTSALVSHFFQGGVQLFNRFDMMNYAYSQLTAGFYTVSNLLCAGVYIVFAPFMERSAEAMYWIFSVGYHAVNIFLRTLGGYLLLKRFVHTRWVMVISLMYLNIFLSTPFMIHGMHTNTLYSYFPLILYFIIDFFEHWKPRSFFLIILMMAIAVANAALFALGNFYQLVHLIIIAGLIISVILPSRRRSFQESLKKWRISTLFWGLGTIVLATLIVLPSLIWQSSLKNDFYIAQSGLGETSGRVANAFNPKGYLNLPGRSYTNPGDLPLRSVDFTFALWGSSWPFIGFTTVVLMLLGLVCMRHIFKYIFIVATILLLYLNYPSNGPLHLSWSHWLNAYTNPFAFLVRSVHMTNLLWVYSTLPLIAVGWQVVADFMAKKPRVSQWPIIVWAWSVALFMVAIMLSSATFLVKVYVLASTGMLLLVYIFRKMKHLAVILITVLVFVDIWALKTYEFSDEKDMDVIKPRVFAQAWDASPVVLDYQNPQILPFRYFVNSKPAPNEPLLNSYQNNYGLYYQFSPVLSRYSRWPSLYEPRHISFKDLAYDRNLWEYLNKEDRSIYSVGPQGQPLQRELVNISMYTFPFDKAKVSLEQNWVEYRFNLGVDFPDHISSTVLSRDYLTLELNVGEHRCLPVQGKIIAPFSFDVRNINKQYLTIALPKGMDVSLNSAVLTLRTPGEMGNIWRNTNDELGFDYGAKSDGWLILALPFDDKWVISVDDKPVDIVKANGIFIAAPITAGVHKVHLHYWPHTPLRGLIVVSVLSIFVILIGIMIRARHWERWN